MASENKPRILVVDDDRSLLRLLTEMLKTKYDVMTAEDGEQALNILASENFDCVLLDVMMPVMNGYDALKIIRKSYTMDELPVIIITAVSEPDPLTITRDIQANDFIEKPYDPGILRERIQIQVRMKKLHGNQTRTHGNELKNQLEVSRATAKQISWINISSKVENYSFTNYDTDQIRIGRADLKTSHFPDIDFTEKVASMYGISRNHAEIRFITERWFVSDRGSTNGTFLNGQQCAKGKFYPLHNQDRLMLGKLVCLVEITSEDGT
jgi:DNA-binding response OmpR family regulator